MAERHGLFRSGPDGHWYPCEGGYNGVQVDDMLFRKYLPSQSRVFESRAGPSRRIGEVSVLTRKSFGNSWFVVDGSVLMGIQLSIAVRRRLTAYCPSHGRNYMNPAFASLGCLSTIEPISAQGSKKNLGPRHLPNSAAFSEVSSVYHSLRHNGDSRPQAQDGCAQPSCS